MSVFLHCLFDWFFSCPEDQSLSKSFHPKFFKFQSYSILFWQFEAKLFGLVDIATFSVPWNNAHFFPSFHREIQHLQKWLSWIMTWKVSRVELDKN